LWGEIEDASRAIDDPLWRLPLWAPYRSLLDSKFADISNTGQSGFGGAITAALFLQSFAEGARAWAHFDIMAYNSRARPGRPVGGEAVGLRALWHMLEARYGG
jgi:leucyl aminopeptidase